jgi:hypothetical protein
MRTPGCLRRSLLLAAFVLVSLPSGAGAVPLVVKYEITGGTTFGGFLGDAPIRSGSLVVTFDGGYYAYEGYTHFDIDQQPNRELPWTLALTATNGQKTVIVSAGPPPPGPGIQRFGLIAFFDPRLHYGRSRRFGLHYLHLVTTAFPTGSRTLVRAVDAGGSQGRLTAAAFRNGSYRRIRVGDELLQETLVSGVRDLVGREVAVPEPSGSSLLSLAVLALAGALGMPVLAHRRRRAG